MTITNMFLLMLILVYTKSFVPIATGLKDWKIKNKKFKYETINTDETHAYHDEPTKIGDD